MDPRLRVEGGRSMGRHFDIPADAGERGMVLGRGMHCQIRIADAQLSREHCRFTFDGQDPYVEDLNSTNGTRLNGEQVTEKTRLVDGDEIGIGSARLVVEYAVETSRRRRKAAWPGRKTPEQQAAELVEALEGKEFAGLRVEKRISEGQLCNVYRARQPEKNVPVAVKLIKPDAGASAEQVNRFIRGARLIAPVRHPNLVRVLKGGKAQSVVYVAMEYVDGSNLHDMIQGTKKPLKAKAALAITRQVLGALQAVYEAGLVVRSVRPDNIVVGKDLKAKIVDFDLVKELPAEEEKEATRLMEGSVSVDPSFAAPELIVYSASADQRTDVFGAGACLYFMLACSAPFEGAVPELSLTKVFERKAHDLTKLNPNVPDSVVQITMKALSEQPGDRYQEPRDMAAAIDEIAGDLQ